MSVLGAGSVGYDDYQRIANFDSGELYSFTAPPSNSTLNSPVLPVLRWAYLTGRLAPNTGPSQLTFTWSSDPAGLNTTGQRTFFISPLIANPLQFRVENMGPYVQVSQGPVNGGNWGCQGIMYGSNRVSLLEAFPTNPVILDNQNTGINAGQTVTQYPTDYFAGPVTLFFSPAFASWTLQLGSLNASGVYDFFYALAGTAVVATNVTVAIPLGAWRAQVTNSTAGNSAYYLSVTPSTTGAL